MSVGAKLLPAKLDLYGAMPVLTWASINMAGKPIGTKRNRVARAYQGLDVRVSVMGQ